MIGRRRLVADTGIDYYDLQGLRDGRLAFSVAAMPAADDASVLNVRYRQGGKIQDGLNKI